jgi:hypothetical protein
VESRHECLPNDKGKRADQQNHRRRGERGSSVSISNPTAHLCVRWIKHDSKDESEKDRFNERSNEKITKVESQNSESQQKDNCYSASGDVIPSEHQYLRWSIALLCN